jgi:tetratricopeptide (TPR) repeat protein
MLKRWTLYICVLALSMQHPLRAQIRVSEEDLTLDQLFMDANLQKVIGNEDKAIAAFEKILETYPDHPAAAFELSRLYQQVEKSEEALKMAKTAVEGEPENKWYKIQLAELFSEGGEQSAAIDLYEILIEQDPRNQELYYKQAFFHVKAENIRGAIKVYESLEERIGLSEEVVRRKHALYLGMGDFKAAGKEFMRLTEAFPENVDYKLQLASFYEQIDDQKAALEVYQQILQLDPDQPRAKLAVAGGSTRGNDEVSYLNALKPVFEDPTASIDLKVGKILPLLQQLVDRPDPALATALMELTDILERVHSDDAKSFAAAGDVLVNTNRYAEAITKYKKAVALDDTIYAVWEQLLFALQITGQAADLAAYAEEATYVFPNQAMIYYHAGLGYLGIWDTGEALYYLQEAQMLATQNKNLQELVFSATGLAHTMASDLDKAAAAFAKAQEINANSGLSNTRYAIYLAEKGAGKEAQSIISKFEKQGAGQAIFAEAKARSLVANDQITEALETLTAYQAAYEGLHPRQLELLGDLYFKNNEAAKALSLWKEAKEAGSKSTRLNKKIADKRL